MDPPGSVATGPGELPEPDALPSLLLGCTRAAADAASRGDFGHAQRLLDHAARLAARHDELQGLVVFKAGA